MDLFYITNLFSVGLAEEIIRQYNIKNCIAVVVNIKNKSYFENIKSNMNERLWKNIELSPVEIYKKSSLKDILLYRNVLKGQYDLFDKMVNDKKITNIYLPNIVSDDEKILYSVCKENGILVHFYEEGTNLYFDLEENNNKFRSLLKYLLAGKNRYIVLNRNYYKAEKLFCCFPEKYRFDNCKDKIQVGLRYELNEYEKSILENLNIDTLFLSRPLSEDGIIPFREELDILKHFINTIDSDEVYFKFHPREDKEKIKVIKKELNIIEVPEKYRNIPAEKLIAYGQIKKLVGYETGTLAYASELYDIKTYSLLNMIKNDVKYLEIIYDFYSSNFKKISFFD